jgi:hypothetical protein
MPGSDGQAVLDVHRRELYKALDPCRSGEMSRRFVSLGDLGTDIHKIKRLNALKRRCERRWFRKIACPYIDPVAEERTCFLFIAHEDTRTFSALQQTMDYPGPHIAGCACNQNVHDKSHFCDQCIRLLTS